MHFLLYTGYLAKYIFSDDFNFKERIVKKYIYSLFLVIINF